MPIWRGVVDKQTDLAVWYEAARAGETAQTHDVLGRLVIISCMKTDLGGTVSVFDIDNQGIDQVNSLYVPVGQTAQYISQKVDGSVYQNLFVHRMDEESGAKLPKNWFSPMASKGRYGPNADILYISHF